MTIIKPLGIDSVTGQEKVFEAGDTIYHTDEYGGMYAYEKAIVFAINTVGKYHAFHLVTAGDIIPGMLNNVTFYAGRNVDPNITSEANNGGLLQIVCSVPHGLVNDDIVVITNANNLAHDAKSLVTINTPTTFTCNNISYVSGAGASAAEVDTPAYLKIGPLGAGVYHLSFDMSFTAGTNKDVKFELNKEITDLDNIVTEKAGAGTLETVCATGNLQLSDGDRVWLSGENLTDTTDITVKDANINLFKIS